MAIVPPSINSDIPNPTLLAYATTKGAIQNFTAGLAQLLAEKGIRANTVAPGPVWTPLIPSTMPEDAVAKFGKQVPMQRPGQPAELATTYVMLADPLSSYVSGATIGGLTLQVCESCVQTSVARKGRRGQANQVPTDPLSVVTLSACRHQCVHDWRR
jgi:NAD(P)-dependent dehydrogenase (short-subunit alcohol dehydrogenase family)